MEEPTIHEMSCEDMEKLLVMIADELSIGEKARTARVIYGNIINAGRRSRCLGLIESYHTITKTSDEGEEYDDCLLNWGDSPNEYIERYVDVIGQHHEQ